MKQASKKFRKFRWCFNLRMNRMVREVIRGRAPKKKRASYSFSNGKNVHRLRPDRYGWSYPWKIWRWHPPRPYLTFSKKVV